MWPQQPQFPCPMGRKRIIRANLSITLAFATNCCATIFANVMECQNRVPRSRKFSHKHTNFVLKIAYKIQNFCIAKSSSLDLENFCDCECVFIQFHA